MTIRVVLAATLSFLVTAGVLVLVINAVLKNEGTPRPHVGNRSGYDLVVGPEPSDAQPLKISADGSGCSALAASALLREACVLATFTDPAYIAAAAYGRLNTEYGPAVEALTWRSWLSNRALDCRDGGLIGVALAKCEGAVRGSVYDVRDGSVFAALRHRDSEQH